jgi:Family of unknown function (DUF5752)
MAEVFSFRGCSLLRESLGLQAEGERQLLERLETVSADSIYFHTVGCLLRRGVHATTFPDDFAIWVAAEVRDLALAERLAQDSPFDFPDIEAFRERLLETLDDHLSRLPFSPRALVGQPFFFLRGHLEAVPLDLEAQDLASFRLSLAQADDSAVYYHVVEAIGRLGNPRGDFASWLEDSLGLASLAGRIQEIDPFVLSLAAVRGRILEAVDDALGVGDFEA